MNGKNDTRFLTNGRLATVAGQRLVLDRSQFFRPTGQASSARWFVDGKLVQTGDRAELEWASPGLHDLVVELDGRRVAKKIDVALDLSDLARRTDRADVVHLIVLKVGKHDPRVLFLPIARGARSSDLSGARRG